MEKVHNLRDLGYLKVGNKQVKSGCFYRSARLDDATENDINELKALGLKHIFDFRNATMLPCIKKSVLNTKTTLLI